VTGRVVEPLVTSTPHRPAALAAGCDLCADQALTDGGPPMTPQPAVGPPPRVRPCATCHDRRPGHDRDEFRTGVGTGALLEREVATLVEDYETGRWLPYRDELHWAQRLAAARWTQGSVEQALRDAGEHVRAGRLVRVVELLPGLLAVVDDRDPAPRSLRRFLDVLAAGPA
jgi:hypothetical protein